MRARRSPGEDREHLERQILDQLDSAHPVTQRSLSSELGIALGLTNLLMRRLVKKGWVRMKHVSPRRIRYFVTPAGMLAKARLTRQYFLSSVAFYRECRERMRERLSAAAAVLGERGAEAGGLGVVFYGGGEVAEVAYVCLHETELTLVGVVDPVAAKLFHLPVLRPTDLSGSSLAGTSFALVIVMPSQEEEEVEAALAAQGVPGDRVFWV